MISIIIPVYNCQLFLRDCLESILKQAYQDFEVICIDDKSSDNSPHILQEYAARDSRIKFIQAEKNSGSGPVRNRGLAEARGEYILFCDADDIYPLSALGRMYAALTQSDCDICAGNIKLMSHDMSYPIPQPSLILATHIDEADVVSPFDCPQLWFPWFHPRFMFKKSFLVQNNIYYPNLLRGQDPPMLAKALCLAKTIAVIPDTVYKYRTSTSQKCSHLQFIDYMAHIKETLKIFDSFGHTKQGDLYIKMMAHFADTFSTFKAFSPNDRRVMTNLYLNILKERNIPEDIPPYYFDKHTKQRLSLMNYGIVIYGLYRIYTLYWEKIKKYIL